MCLTVQLSRFLSLRQLVHFIIFIQVCQELFLFFWSVSFKRRRRDLNPRAAINDLLPFQGSPFGQLGYFSKIMPDLKSSIQFFTPERRGWDSNPRALADKRFSRPPRYDHFDISPYTIFTLFRICSVSAEVILSSKHAGVNIDFTFFVKTLYISHFRLIFSFGRSFPSPYSVCFDW